MLPNQGRCSGALFHSLSTPQGLNKATCTAHDKKNYHRVLEEIFTKQSVARCRRTIADQSHPAHDLFQLLPSGWRYLALRACTHRLSGSFFYPSLVLSTVTWQSEPVSDSGLSLTPCVCVCVCACMHVCVHGVCVVCVRAWCACVCACMHMCVRGVCMCVCVRAWCACMHMHGVCVCACVVCVHMHSSCACDCVWHGVYMWVGVCACVCVCVRAHMHVRVCVCISKSNSCPHLNVTGKEIPFYPYHSPLQETWDAQAQFHGQVLATREELF